MERTREVQLSVTEGCTEPTRVLFAFAGSRLTRKGIESQANSPLLRGLPIHLLMSVSFGGSKQIERAKATLKAAGFDVTPAAIPRPSLRRPYGSGASTC